jgi:hypothetical protein
MAFLTSETLRKESDYMLLFLPTALESEWH